MPKTTTLSFDIPAKEILNSNSMPSHFIQKGKMVAVLREKAAKALVFHHPLETQELVIKRLDQLKQANDQMTLKKRFKKRLESKGLSKEEIEIELAEEFPAIINETLLIKPLFDRFTMKVTVFPPSRRRLDPPNLWPTVKALTDGATDAMAWEDDDFAHLLETSFRYGGLSGTKDWRLELKITEVTDTSEFQLETEVASA